MNGAMGRAFREYELTRFKVKGFECLIKRRYDNFSIYGYVGVPPEHPWYNLPAESVPASAHGGITYAGTIHDALGDTGMLDPIWWVGFDCLHAGDTSLNTDWEKILETGVSPVTTNKNKDFVRGEIVQLAQQAAEAMSEKA